MIATQTRNDCDAAKELTYGSFLSSWRFNVTMIFLLHFSIVK